VGYDFHFGHLTIGPIGAVQYSYVNIDGFSEQGSIAPVAVSQDSEESWRTDLGLRAWYNFQVGRVGVRPFVRAAWEHEYKESALPISARLVDISGPPTTVFGPSLGHDSAVVNAGVAVQWSACISTYVSYDGQLGTHTLDVGLALIACPVLELNPAEILQRRRAHRCHEPIAEGCRPPRHDTDRIPFNSDLERITVHLVTQNRRARMACQPARGIGADQEQEPAGIDLELYRVLALSFHAVPSAPAGGF
jgi:hypothetical protein